MNQLTVEMSLSCQDSLRQVFLISSGHGGHTYEHPYDHIDLPSPRIRTVSGLRSARWWRQAGVSVTIERSWEPNPFNGDGGIKTSGRWRPAWPGGAPVMWTWRAGAWPQVSSASPFRSGPPPGSLHSGPDSGPDKRENCGGKRQPTPRAVVTASHSRRSELDDGRD